MLIPELISSVDIKKGPYFADEGDFASAGAVHINLIDSFDAPTVKATLGSFDYLRYLGLGSIKVGDGDLLYAGEVGAYDGPWVYGDDLKKLNSVLRYSVGTALNGFSLTGMAYGNHWNLWQIYVASFLSTLTMVNYRCGGDGLYQYFFSARTV